MTRDDIIRMAREADLSYTPQAGWVAGSVERLERFAAIVAAHERAACAELCDKVARWEYRIGHPDMARAYECAAAIRARGDA